MNTTATVSELQTARLQLRWLTQEDAELMLAVWNDPDFHRYVGDRGIRSVEQAREALANGALELYRNFGYGPFHLALRDSREPIGICGLFRRDGFQDPDIGWSVLPPFAGNGYAFEAASAVVDYAFRTLEIPKITAFVDAQNLPSVGLARKLGLGFERMVRMAGDDKEICLYSKQHDRAAI